MTSVTNVNLIYLGKYADVDINEKDYNAENANTLVGITREADELSLIKATLYDADHNGSIADNECSSDTVKYDTGTGAVQNQTDSSMSAMLNVTLSDGTVRQIEAVLVQQTNGDLFVTDLLNKGTMDNLSIAKIEIASITGSNYSGWYSNQSVDNTTFAPIDANAGLDGTVQGTSGNDVIDTNYKGDPQGDRIDNSDAIAPGAGAQDDIVVAGAGDDTVKAGLGNDVIYAGSGNDYVEGGDGNDIIYGDKGGNPGTVGGTVRESFEWSKAPDPGKDGTAIDNNDNLTGGFTQNTGSVNVTFSVDKISGSGISTEYATDAQNVSGIVADGAAVNGNSSLESELDSNCDLIKYGLKFTTPVSNVSFNVNDIDGDGVVKVRAFDVNGNEINVDMVGGSKVTLIDTDGKFGVDTADSKGGYEADTSQNYSVTVTIPGPVARIEITHSQNGDADSGVNVTDVYFDTSSAVVDSGAEGQDRLFGGAGNDIIYGEGGNDTLSGDAGSDKLYGGSGNDKVFGGAGDDTLDGGTGTDTLSGGDDRDTLLAHAGDTVDGGAGGTDFDVMVLDDGTYYINTGPGGVGAPVADPDGNSFSGRIVFTDVDGKPTGEKIDYTEIEEIRGGTPFNADPDAVDDKLAAGEDDAPKVIGNVLGNDTDPNGDTLSVAAVDGSAGNVGNPVAGANGGTFTISPTGAVTFDPNDDFESLGVGETATTTITYGVSDGKGGTDTATVTVTVTGANDAPTAVLDTGTAAEDGVTPLTNVLGNDTDPDATDVLKVAAVNGNAGNVGQPIAGDAGGLITIKADGTASFDANDQFNYLKAGETATTKVSYTVSDGNGGTSSTSVEVTVTGTNDAPTATNNVYAVNANEAAGDVDGNVITDNTGAGKDSDPEGDTLKVVGVGQALGNVGVAVAGDNGGLFTIKTDGTVDFNANGEFSNLGLNETATTSVTYTISDGNGGTSTATTSFVVGGNNDGTVVGTAGNDVMNPGYVDGNGDIVDGNDAILPGDTGNDDLILGLGGNDTINAGDGNDEVYGGTGNDSITGGAGNDTVFGDDGNDILRGGNGNDTVYGGTGDDTEFGGDGNDTLYGGAGNDTLNGNADDDLVYGGTGNDSINGEGGNDTLYGDEGNDDIAGGRGSDTVFGGDGDDVIDTGNGIDARFDNPYPGLPGAAGQPDANPFDDRDVVYGGAGNDTITTGDDADSVYGGTGNDTIDVGSDNDFVEGGAGNDTITAGEGVDIIYGDDGDDLIYGGLDNDTLDIVDFDANGNPVDLLPGNNKDTLYGGNGNDTIFGRDDADTIFGGAGNDTLDGGIDDDSITGGAGDDTIYGGQGNDTLRGEDGADLIYGGDGDDTIAGNRGNDTIYGDAGNDNLAGSQDDDLIYGGTGDDTIRGGDGFDTLYGDAGNDNVEGGTQDDVVFGGTGDDELRGNGGADEIYGGDGDDRIFTDAGRPSIPDQDYPGDGLAADPDPFDNRDTVYGGAGNDFIRTGDDADIIYGGDGNDNIDGGIDNDTISSGDGADIVKGGLGSDRFTDASSGDVITGGEDPDDTDIDTFNFDQATLDKIDRIVRNGGAGDSEALRESGTIYFKDGTTATFSEIEAPCFTPGTTIATPKGERLVEDLRQGDKIITRDNGIQEIAWVGSKEMTGKELAAKPHMKPILIKAGSLGQGLPERDMLLSPNHRVLVASEKTQLYFEEREVLAAAKHMTGAQGIHTLDVMRTTYIHFMFERHEVVLSNGAWTESFHPGDYSLNGLGNSQRNEIFELFPELATAEGLEGYQSARKALKKHEARLLMK